MWPPCTPTHLGLHPKTPLDYGPRSDRFVPLTRCARGAAQIYSRGMGTVQSMGEVGYIRLIISPALPHKVIASATGSTAKLYRTPHE